MQPHLTPTQWTLANAFLAARMEALADIVRSLRDNPSQTTCEVITFHVEEWADNQPTQRIAALWDGARCNDAGFTEARYEDARQAYGTKHQAYALLSVCAPRHTETIRKGLWALAMDLEVLVNGIRCGAISQ